MIRPFTCVCLLLAAGAGLYTYQAKHQAELLDREIARVLKLADVARQRAGVLRAEYALLNDPQRLAELAASHLADLRATTPGQYTTLAELDRRLPPIGTAPPAVPPITEPDAVAPPETPPQAVPVANAAPAKPAAIAAAATAVAQPAQMATAQAPLGAPVAPAVWPVTAKPTPSAATTPARVSVVSANPPSRPAARAKPPAPKTAIAAARPVHADPFATPVSAPSEDLARLAAASPGVGRSGRGGSTFSALGMARLANGASLYPAALPSR